jgi:Tol biopolymer transport system component
MDRDGSNPVQLTDGNVESNWPCFSPDSKWVYYQHFEQGSASIWKVPIEGGKPTKVIDTFSIRPVVSPDGKWLTFWQIDGQPNSRWRLGLISLDDPTNLKRFDLSPTVTVQWDTQLRWTPDSKNVTYIDQKAGVDNVWAQPIDGGAASQITNFVDSRIFAFDWSRTGTLAASRGLITSDVVLIADKQR